MADQPTLPQIVEAILFASDEPLSLSKLQGFIPEAKPAEVRAAVDALREELARANRCYAVEEIADGLQLRTRPEYATWIGRLTSLRAEGRLSAASLETLAIVAYKQPIKRVDIESIRGVQCGALLRALMEKDLVKMSGREDVPGSPILYSTTPKFLETFGLKSAKELPQPQEVK